MKQREDKYTLDLMKVLNPTVKAPYKRKVERFAESSTLIPKRKEKPTSEAMSVQVPLVAWFKKTYPKLQGSLFHIPNERKCTPRQGGFLKMLGVRSGVSDLFLAIPQGSYGGFWIELKAFGKKPTINQEEFLQEMAARGYKTAWYDDYQKAAQDIVAYLNNKL